MAGKSQALICGYSPVWCPTEKTGFRSEPWCLEKICWGGGGTEPRGSPAMPGSCQASGWLLIFLRHRPYVSVK